ncbi:MAG: hypothetical protein QNJ97_17830 [Myxococcota bacterium]|nr:hypothetical protein [Myxococcota bacterium]
MPAQFVGKTPEEIAQSYVELQGAYGRMSNDHGELRGTVDKLLQSHETLQQVQAPPDKEEPVTVDTLYDDAEGAIARVANKTVGSRIEALEQRQEKSDRTRALEDFQERHPHWQDISNNPEFLKWATAKPHRNRLAQAAAHQGDLDAADELFSLWEDSQSTLKQKEEETARQEAIQAATLETTSPGHVDTTETFSRSNLLQARLAAKRGNKEARAWLQANGPAIQAAYNEDRITD